MEVRCDKCQARYRVDDARIGPQGLNMRCGKCQNTFKVTRPDAQPAYKEQSPAPAPAAPAPKAAAPAPMPGSPAPKPAAPAAKPVARPAADEGRALEGAGRTMMFQTGNLKSTPGAGRPAARPEGAPTGPGQAAASAPQSPPSSAKPATPAAARPAAKPAEPDARATMVFGQAPVARPAPAKPAPPAKPAAKDDAAGSTMMFGVSPPIAKAPPAAPAAQHAAEAEPHTERANAEPRSEGQGESAAPEDEGSGVEAEGAEEDLGESDGKPGTFDKAPPKGLLIGVAAGLAVLLLGGGALVAVKKLGKHAPPPAAIETLTSAQADADKDSLPSLASAEGKARDAIDVAGPKSAFPQAAAALARIEIQWADALNDQAAQLAAKGGDGAEGKAAELQGQAKSKLKTAFETLSPALKADPKSADLQITLADYYRAQRSNSSMNKALKSAQALKTDDASVAQVQGMALLQEEDGAEKALPKLKVALAGNPQSARLHFRLALAYQALKDEAAAAAELKETLRISPQHERAKLLLEPAASANGK